MKNNLIAAILMMVISISCNPAKRSTKNIPPDSLNISAINQTVADGKSFETAIPIQEKTETPGVHAEYQWIRDHYSGYKVVQQSLATHRKKPFDIITIEFADASRKEIYFDISKFFGHI